MNKLKWKTKYLDDKSGSWVEANVHPLGWTYVIDDKETSKGSVFNCFLFISKDSSEEIEFTKKTFKSVEKAQEQCEKHIESVYTNLCKIFN